MSTVGIQDEAPRNTPTSDEAPAAALGPREGCLIAGRYRVEGRIGVGAMGIVVSARHIELGWGSASELKRLFV